MAYNLTALIVDPNKEGRLDVSRTLEHIGLDVAGEAAYGTEATVLSVELRPTLILLALDDPPVRGLATLEALQQLAPDIPVLVYSTSTSASLMRQAMRAGARDYLEAPVRSEDLRDAVNNVLAQGEQRQMGRWSPGDALNSARGTIITVAGAKGGIGKTTLATNLAIALRQVTGQEVALVDSDAQFGDVAVMLDMEAKQSIADLARNEPMVTRDVVRGYLQRHQSGVDVLLAADEPDDWRAVRPEHVTSLLHSLAQTHEYVIVDTPGVMNEVVAVALHEAALVLLLTSLDMSSVKDTKTAMRILDSWELQRSHVRLVVNDNTHAAAVTAEDVMKATNLDVSYFIAHDPTVGFSVQTGKPILISEPSSPYSRCVLKIAEGISGVAPREVRSKVRMPFGGLRLVGGRSR